MCNCMGTGIPKYYFHIQILATRGTCSKNLPPKKYHRWSGRVKGSVVVMVEAPPSLKFMAGQPTFPPGHVPSSETRVQ